MDLARWLHVLGVVIWVGGMFFAYVALRPAAARLDPPLRLELWCETFRRFFVWVWVAVAAILLTGLHMTGAMGGLLHAPHYALAMAVIGMLMMLIFGHIYFASYARLKRAVAAREWPAGGAALASIRRLVGVNLVLGLATVTIATAGRWLSP